MHAKTQCSLPKRIVCLALLCASQMLQTVAAETHAYFAEQIWTMEPGQEPIHQGVLLVQDGKVLAVGTRDAIVIPAEARRHELGATCIIPGLVVAGTQLVTSSASDPRSISPEIRAIDGFDPFADRASLLQAGITTVQLSPSASKLMPGQGGVVRLGTPAGDHKLSRTESLVINLNAAAFRPSTIYEPPVGAVSEERPIEPTRPQLASSLSQAKIGLQALLSEAQAIAEGKENDDIGLETLASVIDSQKPCRWDVRNNAEASTALQLANQFNLPWIIVNPDEVDVLIGQETWDSPLARGVILNPEFRPGRITNPGVPADDVREPTPVWRKVEQLIAAGAGDRIALQAVSDSDLSELLFSASILGRAKLEPSQIMQMLTINPARMMGVDESVGSLKVGKWADFVVLSGPPLQSTSKIVSTFSAGKITTPPSKSTLDTSSFVVRASQVFSANGLLENASVSVVNGKIAGVGSAVSAPKDAEYRNYSGAYIVPGMLDCGTALGIGGSLSSQVNFGTKLGPFLSRDNDQVAIGRQGGITTALLSSSRLPGPVVAFKLSNEPKVLKDPVAMHFQVRGNLTAAEESLRKTLAAGKAYADSWTDYDRKLAAYQKELKSYEEALKKYEAAKAAADKKAAEAKKVAEKNDAAKNSAKDGEASEESETDDKSSERKDEGKNTDEKEDEKGGNEKQAPDKNDSDKTDGKQSSDGDKKESALPEKPKKPEEPKKPRSSSASEPYRNLFAGNLPALVSLSDPQAVDVVVTLFRKEFDLTTGIVATAAAAKHAKLLAANEVFVVAGPTLLDTVEGELENFAAELAVAGVSFGFQSKATTGVSELPSVVSYAIHRGLGFGDALSGLTTSPTKFFGLDSVGSIQVGNDADLVVLSGPPLSMSTEVLAVMVDGEWVYEKEQ